MTGRPSSRPIAVGARVEIVETRWAMSRWM
jgi:hypothetical protein